MFVLFNFDPRKENIQRVKFIFDFIGVKMLTTLNGLFSVTNFDFIDLEAVECTVNIIEYLLM